ncbi:MAG: DUF3313 domain-containing protein [Haliea sp.]|jgi:hypothetical protein|nr:DUF3313 domain-containing protein [Haliea sp.]
MKRTHTLFAAVFALCVATLAGCANTQTGTKDEWDGLVRQPGTRMDAVFVQPDAELAAYTSVMLDPVEVSFARNWDPNRGVRNPSARLNADDVAAIRSGLADMLRETLRTQLASSGFTLVDEPGPETLRVSAAIVNLFVTAPDTMTAGRGRTYTANSGQMTLVAELRDSDTGDLLARAVDTRRGRSTGAMSFTNNVTNTADARRAMIVWADALVQGLNEMYGRAN